MYYKVVQNSILNNFHYHCIQSFRDFLKTCAHAVNFWFFLRNENKKEKIDKKNIRIFHHQILNFYFEFLQPIFSQKIRI